MASYDSSSRKSSSAGGGVGCLTTILIVFVILKLTHLIDWSWWIVLIPLWIELGIFALFLMLIVIVALIRAFKRKNK